MPVPASALPLDGAAIRAVLAVALVLGLGWLAWPEADGAAGVERAPGRRRVPGWRCWWCCSAWGVVAWALNPYAALLVLGALHLWLLLVDPELRPRPAAALALVALALVPLALLIAFYARELGVGPGGIAWDAVLLLAGGHVGVAAAALWSIACGCVVAATLLALDGPRRRLEAPESTTAHRSRFAGRGSSYAGPGSLGGTESALRR